MRLIKETIKIWNDNFNKGVSVFQIFLMSMMILGAIVKNEAIILFSMSVCLLGYFEPTDNRDSLNFKTDKN